MNEFNILKSVLELGIWLSSRSFGWRAWDPELNPYYHRKEKECSQRMKMSRSVYGGWGIGKLCVRVHVWAYKWIHLIPSYTQMISASLARGELRGSDLQP